MPANANKQIGLLSQLNKLSFLHAEIMFTSVIIYTIMILKAKILCCLVKSSNKIFQAMVMTQWIYRA